MESVSHQVSMGYLGIVDPGPDPGMVPRAAAGKVSALAGQLGGRIRGVPAHGRRRGGTPRTRLFVNTLVHPLRVRTSFSRVTTLRRPGAPI